MLRLTSVVLRSHVLGVEERIFQPNDAPSRDTYGSSGIEGEYVFVLEAGKGIIRNYVVEGSVQITFESSLSGSDKSEVIRQPNICCSGYR